MVTVYPLLQYIVRFQLLVSIFGSQEYRLGPVAVHNFFQTAVGVVMAVLYPNIGNILRYTGAICGLVYVFGLPCLVQVAVLRCSGSVSRWKLGLYYSLIVFGVANLVGQFWT